MITEMIRAAKLGGQQITKYFGKVVKVFNKTTIADFRTTADLASEKAILNELQQHFPRFNYFAEESGWIKNGSQYTFIIDPLDGTLNFSMGLPNFSVTIALQKNKNIICGVTHNPILNQTFYAERGKGAFLDKKRIRTNNTTDPKHATISYTCGYKTDGIILEKLLKAINKAGFKRLIIFWCPTFDYCLLASGKIDCVICNGNEIYDNAAGKLLVKEAGGIITQFDGTKEKDELSTKFVASNNKILHKKVIKICQQIKELSR